MQFVSYEYTMHELLNLAWSTQHCLRFILGTSRNARLLFFSENNLIHTMHEFLIFSMVNEHYLIWGNVKIYCSSLTLRAKISYRFVEFSSQLLYKTGLNAVMVVTLEN